MAVSENLGINSVRRCIRQAELLAMLGGVSRFTLLRWEAEGKFPKRFSLSGGLVLWDLEEVERWLAQQRDEARQSAPETEA